MGWNVYGDTKDGEQLLGTFDTEKAANYAAETVNMAVNTGLQAYIMPEAGAVEEILYYAKKAKRLLAMEAVT